MFSDMVGQYNVHTYEPNNYISFAGSRQRAVTLKQLGACATLSMALLTLCVFATVLLLGSECRRFSLVLDGISAVLVFVGATLYQLCC